MHKENKINYIEIPVQDIEKAKKFFYDLFGWTFTDYGPDYCAFNNAGLDGGFYTSDQGGCSAENGPLVVFYSRDLEAMQKKLLSLSATIVKETFSFPGGRRFHFADPNNNEYAVWSDIDAT